MKTDKQLEELNQRVENFSPKSSMIFRSFMRFIGIVLIIMSLVILIFQPIFGIIGIAFGIFLWLLANDLKKTSVDKQKNIEQKKVVVNSKGHDTYTSSGYFEFPETDPHGHHILKIYDLNVTGVMREFNNIRSQEIIAQLSIGDEIILEADPNNEYDSYAVKVETPNHIQIGWLPRGENLQIDISERLRSGETVYARVKKIYPLSKYPGNNGLVIDVARYSKRV